MLIKRPTQYKAELAKLEHLLEKVQAKIAKTKSVRVDKKTRIKEKMENGEYLPKDVYEATRKAKLEKSGHPKAEKETSEKTEVKERKEKRDFKRGDKPFKKGFNKDEKGNKTKWNKEKGEDRPDRAANKQQKDFSDHKKQKNDKIKDFKKEKAKEQDAPKKLHPSWEAKKDQIDRDTHIKFVQNEIFEF